MIIKQANKTYSKAISELIKESVLYSHTDIYPKDKIDNVLGMYKPNNIEEYMKEGKYFVAIDEDEVIGCVLVIKDEMSSLYVLPKHMKKGIGSKLLEKAELYIKDCNYKHVWIWATLTALDFYKGRGYEEESDITDKEGNTWYIGMKKVFG